MYMKSYVTPVICKNETWWGNSCSMPLTVWANNDNAPEATLFTYHQMVDERLWLFTLAGIKTHWTII